MENILLRAHTLSCCIKEIRVKLITDMKVYMFPNTDIVVR